MPTPRSGLRSAVWSASDRAGELATMLVLDTMPWRKPFSIPSLTLAVRPKSSALTISLTVRSPKDPGDCLIGCDSQSVRRGQDQSVRRTIPASSSDRRRSSAGASAHPECSTPRGSRGGSSRSTSTCTRTVRILSRTASVNQHRTYERPSEAYFGRLTVAGRTGALAWAATATGSVRLLRRSSAVRRVPKRALLVRGSGTRRFAPRHRSAFFRRMRPCSLLPASSEGVETSAPARYALSKSPDRKPLAKSRDRWSRSRSARCDREIRALPSALEPHRDQRSRLCGVGVRRRQRALGGTFYLLRASQTGEILLHLSIGLPLGGAP